jgi:Tfp pilus assembly protein PilF
MALTASVACGAAHVPASDSVVVERLPPAFLALRRVLGNVPRMGAPESVAPIKLEDALANARRYIEIGQTYSDPRAYGYAQSALGKWWGADPAPTEVLVMRARILQFRHEFPAALTQLEAALRADQFDPDAWLLFASISQVQGNVRAARNACLKLIPIADPLIGATCAASTAALGGHGDAAESLLTKTLQQATGASAAERTWAWTTLAEIRERNGDDAGAQNAFAEALRLSPDDVYARAAYADLLLDRDRARDARAVLGDPAQADALLLRAAIAAQRLHDADATTLQENLAQRFSEARARGDDTHLREQARFALEVVHDAARALELAQRDFKVQQEPADARVLLETAHAAANAPAAKPALDWLQRTGVEAPRLQRLARAASEERAR